MSEREAMKREGAKGFSVVLQELEDGALHTELSEKLQGLMKELTDHSYFHNGSGVGKISLEMTIKCDEKGVATIVSAVKVTPPKRKRSATTMFVTEGNNLSVENPRQRKLPLHGLPAPATAEVPENKTNVVAL